MLLLQCASAQHAVQPDDLVQEHLQLWRMATIKQYISQRTRMDKANSTFVSDIVWLSMRILIQSISFSHESSWAGMASCRKFLAFESSWPFQLLCCRNPYLCYLKVYVAYCSPRALSGDWNLQSSIPWRCNMPSYVTRFVMLYLNPKEHVHEPPRAT